MEDISYLTGTDTEGFETMRTGFYAGYSPS